MHASGKLPQHRLAYKLAIESCTPEARTGRDGVTHYSYGEGLD